MASVLDIVTDGLRELGVLAAGEVASADDGAYGLRALNRLLDQWAAERLAIYEETRTTFTIVSGTQAYSIGTGGTVNVARPVYLRHVAYYDTSLSPVQEIALDIVTFDGWAGIPQKTLTGTAPTHVWYATDYPLGSLKLWPVPTSSTLVGVVYAPEQVSEFASLAATVSLPPGWRRMLVKNLAVELAPSYDKPAGRELTDQALESVRVVKRSNLKMTDLAFEYGGEESFDIEEG